MPRRGCPQTSRHDQIELAELFLRQLPGPATAVPAPSPADQALEQLDKLENTLQGLPEGHGQVREPCRSPSAVPPTRYVALVQLAGPEIARLVRDKSGGIPSWLNTDLREGVLGQTFEAQPNSHVDAAGLGRLEERAELISEGIFEESEGDDDVDVSLMNGGSWQDRLSRARFWRWVAPLGNVVGVACGLVGVVTDTSLRHCAV